VEWTERETINQRTVPHDSQAVRDDRPPVVTGEDGRIVVEMFTAVYRSNRLRQPIKFPLEAHE
jgi:hypothetical protein